jgi:hypothetical protein
VTNLSLGVSESCTQLAMATPHRTAPFMFELAIDQLASNYCLEALSKVQNLGCSVGANIVNGVLKRPRQNNKYASFFSLFFRFSTLPTQVEAAALTPGRSLAPSSSAGCLLMLRSEAKAMARSTARTSSWKSGNVGYGLAGLGIPFGAALLDGLRAAQLQPAW